MAMTSQDPLRDSASALLEAADAIHRAAATRGSHLDAPEALACREGRSTVTPLLSRSVHVGRAPNGHPDGEPSWFESRRVGDAVLR